MSVQTPPPVTCTFAPLPVHAPLGASETRRPDDAVALTWKSGLPSFLSGSGPNVIVCRASTGQDGPAPAVEHGPAATPICVRLVASSSAAPASRTPQPMTGVQPATV